MQRAYTPEFYKYINAGSLSSARIVVPALLEMLAPRSVLDVGCGAGAWCSVWVEMGVPDVKGLDGNYVRRESLLIDEKLFSAADLSKAVDLGRKFDLVTTLEVAEHLSAESADVFVDTLVRHGGIILFSAATPGQGGEYHVNEQPLEYWREKFRSRGYACFDPVREVVAGASQVERWYRYNTLLYVEEERIGILPDVIRATRVHDGEAIRDLSPLDWRMRNALIRLMPQFVVDALVKIKHAWVRRKYEIS